jgi:hypothetical protein
MLKEERGCLFTYLRTSQIGLEFYFVQIGFYNSNVMNWSQN